MPLNIAEQPRATREYVRKPINASDGAAVATIGIIVIDAKYVFAQ
jgi:hypothetical protein